MRFLGALSFLSFLLIAVAGAQEEAAQALERWTKAFTAFDGDGVVKLYASNATFFSGIGAAGGDGAHHAQHGRCRR